MANGSHKPGPAFADRIRERYQKRGHHLRESLTALRHERELPSYRDSDSEITANTSGLHAKGIPPFAWWMIGAGIAVFIGCSGAAILMLAL